MKMSIVLLLIAAAIYLYEGEKTTIEKLMDVEYPIFISKDSGFQEYTPKEGAVINMAELIEPGHINIIHLYNPTCDGCTIMDNNLNKMLLIRPDIAITAVLSPHMVNYQAKIADRILNVKYVPFIIIYNRKGELVAVNDGDEREASALLYEWLNEEVRRKNKQNKKEWLQKNK